MGYIEQSLGQNETLIYKARFHWLYFAGAWTVLILLIVSVILIIFYATAWVAWVLLCACIIGLLFLLRGMIPIWTTEIAVTNHRLIVKRGWLSRSTDELQLRQLSKSIFSKGSWEGYLTSAGLMCTAPLWTIFGYLQSLPRLAFLKQSRVPPAQPPRRRCSGSAAQ